MTINHLADGQDLTTLAQPGCSPKRVTAASGSASASRSCSRRRARRFPERRESFAWGGAAGTAFWVDPVEQMIVVFMTQIMQMGLPSPDPIRRELRTLTYSAVIE